VSITPARALAFTILQRMEKPSTHADDLLQSAAIERLKPADRNLVTALVMETLRWQLLLDQQIRAQLTKPNQKLDLDVLLTLRLAAVQLLHMDRIPAHAAINDSVELTKKSGHRYSAGLVNAVLRKLASQLRPTPQQPHDAASLAAQTAHPLWMVERWVAAFGLPYAIKICTANQQQPEAHLRVLDDSLHRQLLAEDSNLKPGALLSAAICAGKQNVTETVTNHPAAPQGAIRRMDEGSQLIAELAGHGQQILDCCAAPGGKTLILAERNPHSAITACDISPIRLSEMKQRLAIENITYLEADAATLNLSEQFDLILCDAPCSGTGTLARNPEIRHRLTLADVARHAERQQKILSASYRALKPGGRLLYSTCSLEAEENEAVLVQFLATESSAKIIPIEDRLRELERDGILVEGAADSLMASSVSNHCLRTLPGITPTDGFFAAILTKSI
jgi:16S rRNA (cytosine967-C5)-methyltransferase